MTTQTDDTTTTTRRTRTDLRYLADAADGSRLDPATATDPKRNSRLRAHGWATSQGALTNKGHRIARVTKVLVSRDLLDVTVDIVGMADYVEACHASEFPFAFFAGVRSMVNVVDEAIHDADLSDYVDDFDATPTYTFEPRDGVVEVGFDADEVAREFEAGHAPDRWDVERKHDERFKRNRNPRRFRVDLLA